MHRFSRLLVAAATTLSLLSGVTMAQDSQPGIKFNLFEIDGLITSDTYSFDQHYGEQQGISVPSPFRLHIARQDQVTPLFEPGTEPGGMFVKINFTTGDNNTPNADRQLIENLQFFPMTLPMKDLELRLQDLATSLIDQGFPKITQNGKRAEFIGVRDAQINGIDVIDVVGKYIDRNLGLMYVRITGFVHPTKADSVYSVVTVVASRYDITNMNQLFLTGSGKTLERFEYLD